MADFEALKKAYIFQGVTTENMEQFAALGKKLDLAPNKELILAGEKSSDLFIVLSGKVNILTTNGDKLAEIGEGGVLGEIALIDDQPRSAHAVAITPVSVMKIASNDIRNFFAGHKDVGFVVMTNIAIVLATRLRKADKTIDHLLNLDPWKHAT